MNYPFFSVITVCKNSEINIQSCLTSLYEQEYKNYEHIIQDGISTDNTHEIIVKNSNSKQKLYIERDNGIYDALNKAISKSRGKYVLLLHSDDQFYDKDVLQKLKNEIVINNFPRIIINNIVYIDAKGNVTRTWKSELPTVKKIKFGWMAPHTGLVLKKDILNEVEPYDINFKISADYGYELKLFKSYIDEIKAFDITLIKMRTGGKSNKNFKSIFIKTIEDITFMRRNKINPFIGIFFKNFLKLKQFWVN